MTKRASASLLDEAGILPDTASIDESGVLSIGGCRLTDLAAGHGTPLYVFDEASIRARARAYRAALATSYPGPATVCYASKAYCAPWLLGLLTEEGLGLDVVSGGELYTALAAGAPPGSIYFHGNNKGRAELEEALSAGVGRIVVDNVDEIELLGRLAKTRGIRQPVLLRVSPGVDAHTHAHLHTGGVDTKFGLGIDTGQAAEGVRAILALPSLELRGLHAHIGSQIAEIEPYRAAVERLFAFAAEIRVTTGVRIAELSPGGGYGVRYTADAPTVTAAAMIEAVGQMVAEVAEHHGFADPLPSLTIEPGRSMIATSAVALYEVGSVKAIPGGRTYVAVDGGMADNIRPTAYGAAYSAILANRATADPDGEYAIAGKYCETGDVLIQAVALPRPQVGDLVAIPTAGAYHLSMASNYNMAPRPAVVVVSDGVARLVRRRETYADLLASERFEPADAATIGG